VTLTQIFDNLDGKQARKRQQASPLGMLFDHGCDAVNSFVNAMTVSKLFGVQGFMQALVIYCVCSGFFFATLEHYYTHYFYLGKVNAVNEGIVFLVLLMLLGGIMGRHRLN